MPFGTFSSRSPILPDFDLCGVLSANGASLPVLRYADIRMACFGNFGSYELCADDRLALAVARCTYTLPLRSFNST